MISARALPVFILFAGLSVLPVLSSGQTSGTKSVSNTSTSLAVSSVKDFQVISRGGDSGPYQAFPDCCKLANGDIVVPFYTGYGHVSLPKPGFEKGGRICMVRSSDEGRTWTKPRTIYDDNHDNRDPHIGQLSDGTMICSFFSLAPIPGTKKRRSFGAEIITSHDNGKTWDKQSRVIAPGWYLSAPVRQLKDGTCILGLYHADPKTKERVGGVILSTDLGKTWSKPHPIGKGQGLPLDAETDVIELNDGRIFAALRTNDKNMYGAYSKDDGKTWDLAFDLGFKGHAPHLLRLKTGEIILSHRLPNTSMHVSRDETKTWQGPYIIDNVAGAYTGAVQLSDGSVLIVYYTEGKDSVIREKRFRLTADGPEFLPVKR